MARDERIYPDFTTGNFAFHLFRHVWALPFSDNKTVLDAGRGFGLHFLGHRPDLPVVLADVDLLVHFSLTPDLIGLVVLEVMVMQVPVVATRGGGQDEIVTHREPRTLVPRRNTAALADAIGGALRGPRGRKAVGLTALRRVQEPFSAESTMVEIEAHLEPLVPQ